MGQHKDKLKSNLYTFGKFGKSFGETTDNGNLYDRGKIKAKLQPQDIPDDYCPIHNKTIWYMDGYIRTSNIKHVAYQPTYNNHLFKDDTLFISYERQIKTEQNGMFNVHTGADFIISGNDIVRVVKHAEQHNPNIQNELQHVKSQIRQKTEWFKQNQPTEYNRIFTNNEDDPFKSDYFPL